MQFLHRSPILSTLTALALVAACLDTEPELGTSAQEVITWPDPRFDPAATRRLEMFGFQSMSAAAGFGRYDGNPPPVRTAPLLMVYADVGHAVFDDRSFDGPTARFDMMFFGNPASVLRTVRGAFLQISSGRFTWDLVGTERVALPFLDRMTATDEQVIAGALSSVAADLSRFDTNFNGVITPSELMVVVVRNYPNSWGLNRWPAGNCATVRGGKRYCGAIPIFHSRVDFATTIHELLHPMGAPDMYGPWENAPMHAGTSVMAGTVSDPGMGTTSLFPDAWTRFQLGWLRPEIVDIASGPRGTRSLRCGQDASAELDGSILFWDSRRGTDQFWLLEARCPFGFDDGLADRDGGLALWDVMQDALHRQLPNQTRTYAHAVTGCTNIGGVIASCTPAPSVCLNDLTSPINADACLTGRLLHRGDNGPNGWTSMFRKDGSRGDTVFRVNRPIMSGTSVVGFEAEWFTGANPPPLPPLPTTPAAPIAPTGVSASSPSTFALQLRFTTVNNGQMQPDVRIYRNGIPGFRTRPLGGFIRFDDTQDVYAYTNYTYKVCTVSLAGVEACATAKTDTYGGLPQCPSGYVYCNGGCRRVWQCPIEQ